VRKIFVGDDEALAVLTFNEIAQRLGMTPPQARSAYAKGMKKLRRNTEALENMRALATELERHRPVELDWFGAEEELTEASVAGGSRVPKSMPVAGMRANGETQPGSILQRSLSSKRPSGSERPQAGDLRSLRQADSQTGTATGEVSA
jgi:hypothetical protein